MILINIFNKRLVCVIFLYFLDRLSGETLYKANFGGYNYHYCLDCRAANWLLHGVAADNNGTQIVIVLGGNTVANGFSEVLYKLRRERGFSQRKVAADLLISQALLSHYENGAREPGLNFVCKVCDYYGVSADYLLCRTAEVDGVAGQAKAKLSELAQSLRVLADNAEL